MKNCGPATLCASMSSRLQDGHVKGLVAVETVNLITGKTRLLGVAYKSSATDKGLLLNACPWCRGEPGYFTRCDTKSEVEQ